MKGLKSLAIAWIAWACFAAPAPLLGAAADPPTELYIRTVPAGAKVLLDGKPLGTSPGLFEVKPGIDIGQYKLPILRGHRCLRIFNRRICGADAGTVRHGNCKKQAAVIGKKGEYPVLS